MLKFNDQDDDDDSTGPGLGGSKHAGDVRHDEMTFCSKRYWIATGLILGISVTSGCSSLPSRATKDLNQEIPAEQPPAEDAHYYVEIHPPFGKAKLLKGKLNQPTTVQKALESSGALEDVRSPQVDLYRMLPGGAPPLKMPIELKGKQVKYEQDYAVHPNDRIVVRRKTENALDKIVDSLTK